MIPVVDADPTAPVGLADREFLHLVYRDRPSPRPVLAQRGDPQNLEYGLATSPAAYIGLISPTPLLLIVALKDQLAVSDLAIAAYERAYEPKKLVLLPGGHFDAYVAEFDQSSRPAFEWFPTHLMAEKR